MPTNANGIEDTVQGAAAFGGRPPVLLIELVFVGIVLACLVDVFCWLGTEAFAGQALDFDWLCPWLFAGLAVPSRLAISTTRIPLAIPDS